MTMCFIMKTVLAMSRILYVTYGSVRSDRGGVVNIVAQPGTTVRGAREHGLPEEYVRAIERVWVDG